MAIIARMDCDRPFRVLVGQAVAQPVAGVLQDLRARGVGATAVVPATAT